MGGLPEEVTSTTLCEEAAAAIKEKTGFQVVVVEKQHLFFREYCRATGECSERDINDILLQRGNCIPLALARLMPQKLDDILHCISKENHKNAEANIAGSRCYGYLFKELRINAAPEYGVTVKEPGNYIVHMENDGNPHGIAFHVRDDLSVDVWDQKSKTVLTTLELQEYTHKALDSATLVTFRIYPGPPAEEEADSKGAQANEVLLSLHAGAGEVNSEWQELLHRRVECQAPETGTDDECALPDDADQDESSVHAGDVLLAHMQQEVEDFLKKISAKQHHRCLLCPFRRFSKTLASPPACSELSHVSTTVRLQRHQTAQSLLCPVRQRSN